MDVKKLYGQLSSKSSEIPLQLQCDLNQTIRFRPGKLGIKYTGNEITKISVDSQAEHAGVQIGWKILCIDNQIMPNDKEVIKKKIVEIKNKNAAIDIIFLT